MKRGDLVRIKSKHVGLAGIHGWLDADPHADSDDHVFIPDGSVGMLLELPRTPDGKALFLVNGQALWVEPIFSVNIDETR
jgi:hypothetical protein